MKLEVSTRHVKLRVILFALFFIVAIASFTLGFVNLGKKSSGYQLIEAATDEEALLYNNDVLFKYFFDGTSNEIKHEIKTLEVLYTQIYGHLYKILDTEKSYNEHTNLYDLNNNRGAVVKLSAQLYEILKDSYSKTLEKKGFNMFAGNLYDQWKSILILQEPSEFDPLFNETEKDRISTIAKQVQNLDNFNLEFLSDTEYLVRFTISSEYEKFLREYELDSNIIDLNVLKDSYLLQYVAQGLSDEGYTLGYLSTAEGLAICPSTLGQLEYDLYTLENNESVKYASILMKGKFCASTSTAFGMGSDYSYTIEKDNKTYYRSLNFDKDGIFSDVLMSLTLLREDNNLVDLSYLNVQMNNLKTKEEVESFAERIKNNVIASYTYQSN